MAERGRRRVPPIDRTASPKGREEPEKPEVPEIEIDHVEENQPPPAVGRRRDIFGGGDPIGAPIEPGEGGKHRMSQSPLTAYQRGQSGVPRFVGPAPRRPGIFRRILRWFTG